MKTRTNYSRELEALATQLDDAGTLASSFATANIPGMHTISGDASDPRPPAERLLVALKRMQNNLNVVVETLDGDLRAAAEETA